MGGLLGAVEFYCMNTCRCIEGENENDGSKAKN